MQSAEPREDGSSIRSALCILHSDFSPSFRMNINPLMFPARVPKRRKRHAVASSPTPPPVIVDQIVSVTHAGGMDQVIVSVTSPVASIMPDLALWVSVDGSLWFNAINADVSDPMMIVFGFGDDIAACTMWRV